MSQSRIKKLSVVLFKQVTMLSVACSVFAATSKNNEAKHQLTDQLVDVPSLPYLTKTEVQKMQLLRLWHTRPVVEGYELGFDILSKDNGQPDLNYLPEQIQGRHAKFYSKTAGNKVYAKDVACRDTLENTQNLPKSNEFKNYKSEFYNKFSGVVRMGGLTYAKSYEPVVDRQDSNRYKYMTSIQAGQNFSFGGWIRFARPEIEIDVYEKQIFDTQNSREKLRQLIPDYYTFLGKSPDKSKFDIITQYSFNQANKRIGEYVRDMKPEWQFYMTNEMLYLGSFQGDKKHSYYKTNSEQNINAINNYSQYQDCLQRQNIRQQAQLPAEPLARSLKPVPTPIVVVTPVTPVNPGLPPENCVPAPILIPPKVGGVNKKHIWDFNIKNFKYAETWSSTYKQTKADTDSVHYEAWHFLNVSFDLVDPIRPTVKLSIISLPYLDRLSKNETYNALSRCIFKVKDKTYKKPEMLSGDKCVYDEIEYPLDISTSALTQLLMNETDSPVMIGSGELYSEKFDGSANFNDRIYRSGTYISRAALNKNQVLRMAEVLFPAAAVNCTAKDLKPIFPSKSDFASEY